MIFRKIAPVFLFLFFTIEAKSVPKNSDLEPFTLNEFFSGTFSTKSINATWFSDDTLFYISPKREGLLFNVTTKEVNTFLESSVFDEYVGSPTVSADKLYVLIRYSVSSVFRHSTTALYTIYDIETKEFFHIADQKPVQNAQWSPQGHGIVYVYLNNIYYLPDPRATPITITTDGVEGVLYNGVPDWVYEEEVLGTGSALWFSPNGKQLVFASFNDTDVQSFLYFVYGQPGSLDDQYPQNVTIRYPKVGTKNPVVQIYVVNLENLIEHTVVNAIPESTLATKDYILYNVVWVTNEEFAVLYSNRVQNKAELMRCSNQGVCTPEASYKEDNGWLEPKLPKYNSAGTQKIEVLAQPQNGDKFDHLVHTDLGTNTVKRLTKGPFYVTGVYGWDEVNNLIYFLRTVDDTPYQRHVYVLDLNSEESKCLTCDVVTSRGPCTYAGATFSKDFSYMAKVCQGPGPYVTEIHSLKNETEFVVWEDNQVLNSRLESKAIPIVKNLRVPVANGFQATVRLLLPPDFDESKKYPAVVYVYAGPNSNGINDAYSSGFQNYIVTNRQYIYIYIDGRGSGLDGQSKMFQVYRNLAIAEIEDQIAVTKWLQQNCSYIDADNTGIWGWSYGGFATAWVLVKDTENVFKFGLSVAPVTSFIYYDSIYTERYMGLPTNDDNLGGYNNTDVTRNVEALRNKQFFLIHGNADDNVHYQQSMLLSKALELADIEFQQQSYPDENHSLGRVSRHLYHTIDRFWARSFNLPDPPA